MTARNAMNLTEQKNIQIGPDSIVSVEFLSVVLFLGDQFTRRMYRRGERRSENGLLRLVSMLSPIAF